MTDLQPNLPASLGRSGPFDESPQELYLDLDVLAQELAQELLGDPLDALDSSDPDAADVAAECDLGLSLLVGDHDQRMQGLRIFCEHRDPRALPLLLPLLAAPCPIVRMSAVYALAHQAIARLGIALEIPSDQQIVQPQQHRQVDLSRGIGPLRQPLLPGGQPGLAQPLTKRASQRLAAGLL